MGFFKWLQKKGSTGSIARWVVKQYRMIKSTNPDLDDDRLFEKLFENRYSLMTPKGSERIRYDEVERGNYFSVMHTENLFNPLHHETESDLFSLLHMLCMAIVYIEMNVSPNDSKLYKQCSEIISEELKRLGIN